MIRTKTRTIVILSSLSASLFAAGACNRTPEEAHTDAVEAQKQATRDIDLNNQNAKKTIDDVQREAAKTTATATQKADEAMVGDDKKIAEAKQDALRDNAAVQAKANEKIRAANAESMGEQADMRLWGQKKIDGLNNKIDGARAKSLSASVKARTSFEHGMTQVQVKRDKLSSELAAADPNGVKASAFKTHLDTEVARLETKVAELERRL